MLELRPTCENCNKPLPPNSMEAMICSFECTFCRECTEHILEYVCPNCGGNLLQRPIRPLRDWHGGNNLANYPASQQIKHVPVDVERHKAFVAKVKPIPPEDR